MFFLLSWVVQVLFNSIVVGHFGLLAPLTYWQAATLLFLFMILLAWGGWGLGLGRSLVPIEAASFFLAAWIFQLLFNSLIVGHFGLLRPVSYLQAAGLLFLAAIFTAWLGFAVEPRRRAAADLPQLGRRIKDEIRKFFEER
ncbi:MAG: hypothetical protein XD60_0031 [Acetothermia bacterium 64_32]|nr:MAG: hypothetical protein XD60_0031 [Acetothermia bacterium 64_32]